MNKYSSQSHVRWDCKYHVVLVAKYRKKVIFGSLRKEIGPILKELLRQNGEICTLDFGVVGIS